METVIPDHESVERIDRENATLSPAERYRLAQADTLLRISGADSMVELEDLVECGKLDEIVQAHNRKMRRTDPLTG